MVALDGASVDRVNLGFWSVVLLALAAVLFGIGWLVGKFWLAVAWSWAAIRLGFREGRTKPTVAD